ncbi:armadillo-type protein [Myxozyma melibiosi]|uniref:Armadillo-type protein n=1 Tax=Myxozyma melibiosi TaxID=54550 RepID=A0ABR1F2H0_9ASCO
MAVISAIRALFESSIEELPTKFIPALKRESEKKGMTAADYFVLLEWANEILSLYSADQSSQRPLFDRWHSDLVAIQTLCLDACLSFATDKKTRLAASAEKSTRVALNSVLTCYGDACAIYLDILASKTSKLSSASLLGALINTASDLKTNQQAFKTLQDRSSEIFALYCREILGSKAFVGAHNAKAFNRFFQEFLTPETLLSEIAGPFERSILRAPEFVLGPVSLQLIRSIPSTIDCSVAVSKHFLNPLLSALKSSKDVVRENSAATLRELFKKCMDSELVPKIANELITPLKTSKVTAADQRALYIEVLSSLPSSSALAKSVPAGLITLASKETNEAVVSAIANCMLYFVKFALDNEEALEKTVSESILKGLTDKRANLRRLWIMAVGEFGMKLTPSSSKASVEFVASTLPKLLESWKEIIANASAAVQSKLIVSGYVVVALTKRLLDLKEPVFESAIGKSAKIIETALTGGSKASFFLQDRVYTKISTREEQTWCTRALSATASSISPTKENGAAWALAFIYFITNPAVDARVRQDAAVLLGDAFLQSPVAVGKSVILALWKWIRQLEDPAKKEQSPAISALGLKQLRIVLQAITPRDTDRIPSDVRTDLLIETVVITHHELLDKAQDWITLCQRLGIDPGELVGSQASEFEKVISTTASEEGQTESVIDATMKAAATLAFVRPDVISPFLRDMLVEDLDASRLEGITEEYVSIWHTPDNVLCIDVLSKEREKYAVDKNTKDYATLKWEAEVRAELAKKQAPTQKKLTKEERAKVDAQLKLEKGIREKVQNAYLHVNRGVKLIHFLSAAGTDNGAEVWFPAATKSLVYALRSNLSMLVGSVGIDTFLELSDKVSPRVGPLRRFIGVALLRAIQVADVPESLSQEPLRELVVRIMYRLRFLSEQIPLDAISLIYILPLIMLIFAQNGIECRDTEEKDEQLMLAIETLTYHTEIFANTSVPRLEVLVDLIKLMKAQPSKNKSIKECLLGLCQSMSANINDDELNVFLAASISEDSFVRAAVLEGIDSEFEISHIGYSSELWIACHDENELNSKTANAIWEESDLSIDEQTPLKMLTFLETPDASIRNATSRAIKDALEELSGDHPTLFHDFLQALMDLYRERAKPPATIYDEFGMVAQSSLDQKDPWEARSGVAVTFREIAPIFPESELMGFVAFLIEDGALGDKEPDVRQQMQDAAIHILDLHAKNSVDTLMPIIETCLAAKHNGSEVQDRIKESAIVLYGTLARHLDDDARLPPIIERLIATLRAPSENVQFAVSESLPPLVKRVDGERISKYVEKLLNQLFAGNKYSERRGAAYGLAGLVKGVGISALADYDIIRSLSTALEDKKDPKKRQGVQFAFETLSMSLGKFFEPYAIEILPFLLTSLGDASNEVREATSDAAKEIMKHTTSYGIKQLVPLTLDFFNQSQWRSKKGAVELLGTMAYLDPRQLSESLSDIIPEIVGALNDTHKEVRKAASQSLQRFGEVISNPEIQTLVPVLLKAISDPTKNVETALDALLKTSFVHYIDAPSLALIVYILKRGLRERSASTKRKACQIVGNMASLTDSKDLLPYLNDLVAELEISMVDPVPATRGTASRALGSLIEKLGEEQMPNLIPKLLSTLRADNNEGDRLGAAQALSEVISGLGVRKLEELLPVILKNLGSSKPNIRESFMNLMVFLPAAFGNNFSPYLARVIPPILAGLADESEVIRDTSLRAGRLIVKNYATRAVDLLLPELERGLSDENYRIRLSSIELTGDLLFQITGVSSTNAAAGDEDEEVDEDSAVGGEVHSSLKDFLGAERRDRILALLYLCRSDVTALVRNAAVDVWKVLVPNTPRTVKDILPILSQLIIRRLSSSDEDQRENASQTLSELVRRFGDSLLTQVLPTLESGLFSSDSDAKQGICVALSELIEATPMNVLEVHENTLIGFIRGALVDSDASVREAAAQTFDTLQETFGNSAIDQILPHLLNLLQTAGQSEYALAALKEIMSSKSDTIFPVLLPILLKSPMTAFNARAMGSLAEVAGSSLYRKLQSIIESMFDEIIAIDEKAEDKDEEDEETKQALNDAIDTIVKSVDEDEDGIELVSDIFLELAEDEAASKRALAFIHMAAFFETADGEDYAEFVQPWITIGLSSLSDEDSEVVAAAWKCLSTVVSKLPKEALLDLVIPTSKQLRTLPSSVAGFALAKGPNAILPICSQGLMYGTTEQREYGARGIGYIVERTPADILRPFVTLMVGPLIRTVGERFPSEVKVAILDTLAVMLSKIPAFLRPFLPQLQRTFTKSLADAGSGEELQRSAQKALDVLTAVQQAAKK